MTDICAEHPHEECGVFGVYDPAGDCARMVYYGLYTLQHQGQEACGIAAINDRELSFYKDVGLVGDVFTEGILDELGGTMAVGHVRCATTGAGRRENAQPLTLKYVKGALAVAHNGNLVNTQELRSMFGYRRPFSRPLPTPNSLPTPLPRSGCAAPSAETAVCQTLKGLRGAWPLIVMSARKPIAARDPWVFRPLYMGRGGMRWYLPPSPAPWTRWGAQFERDLEPGEIVVVEQGEVRPIRENCVNPSSHLCILEYIYSARPDSVISGQSVHRARVEAGRILAWEHPVEADKEVHMRVSAPLSLPPATSAPISRTRNTTLPATTPLRRSRGSLGRTAWAT